MEQTKLEKLFEHQETLMEDYRRMVAASQEILEEVMDVQEEIEHEMSKLVSTPEQEVE